MAVTQIYPKLGLKNAGVSSSILIVAIALILLFVPVYADMQDEPQITITPREHEFLNNLILKIPNYNTSYEKTNNEPLALEIIRKEHFENLYDNHWYSIGLVLGLHYVQLDYDASKGGITKLINELENTKHEKIASDIYDGLDFVRNQI